MDVLIADQTLIRIWQFLFVVTALVQFFYLFYFHLRLALYKVPEVIAVFPPVTIIIAARNEYDNLLANLPMVLEQDYPEYEVIVVNDGSWDDSASVLLSYKERFAHLRIVNRPENERSLGGKKLAVTLGIKAAKYDRLLLTDADCRPKSKKWIAHMMQSGEDDQIILGYSPYTRSPGLLNWLIRFDSMLNAVNYFGFALARMPYMGVGRNLSYPKEKFFAVGGFRRHYSLASGDDDLFVNEVATGDNTRICLLAEATVESTPEKTWKNFWRQKKRHLTTGWRYRPAHKWLLGVQSMSYFIFLVSTIGLLVYQAWIYAVISVVLLRMLTQISIFRRSVRWLGQNDLVFLAPILEILVLAFSTCVHLANVTSKKTIWKT